MTSVESRVAVLETLAEGHEKDANALFKIMRKHMEKEEDDRRVLLDMIGGLRTSQAQMKAYFIGGFFVLSIIWSLVTTAVIYFT